MKQNRLALIVGLILVMAVAIQGFFIYDLHQQINKDEAQPNDSLSVSDLHD